MRLDAALISPDLDWFTTRAEKLALLVAMSAAESSESSPERGVHDRDQFPGTCPIGIDETGRAALVYVATVPWTDDFRSFLFGHLPFLSVTPTWTLRIVFPPSLQRTVDDYRRVVHEELESRLDAQTVNDLQWYFFHCRRRTDWSTYSSDVLKARLARCAKAFAGPRFTRLYRRWLTEGETALTPIPGAVSEALASGRATLDCCLLPHTYDHLSPLVSRRRLGRRRIEKAEERGEETSPQP